MLALISLGMEKGSRDAASAAVVPDRSCWASGLDILDSWGRTATRSVGRLTQPEGGDGSAPQNAWKSHFCTTGCSECQAIAAPSPHGLAWLTQHSVVWVRQLCRVLPRSGTAAAPVRRRGSARRPRPA